MAVPLRRFRGGRGPGKSYWLRWTAALYLLYLYEAKGIAGAVGGRFAILQAVGGPLSQHLGLLGDAWRLLAHGHDNLVEPRRTGAVTRSPGKLGLRHDRVDRHPARVIAAAAAGEGHHGVQSVSGADCVLTSKAPFPCRAQALLKNQARNNSACPIAVGKK